MVVWMEFSEAVWMEYDVFHDFKAVFDLRLQLSMEEEGDHESESEDVVSDCRLAFPVVVIVELILYESNHDDLN